MNSETEDWWRESLNDFMKNDTHGCDMDGLWIVIKLIDFFQIKSTQFNY